MKKIIVPFVLLAMLIVMACNTTKNNLASTANAPTTPQPAQTPGKPQKGEMKESDMKITPVSYEKKTLPVKGKMQPMEALIVADSVVPKNR